MKKYQSEAKTRDLALKNCLEEAKVSETDVLIHEEEIAGSLLKKTKYKITVVTVQDIKNEILNFISELSKLMNIEITATVLEEEHIFKVLLDSNNNSILIGKDGKTMKSIQIILKQAILMKAEMNIKINLDVSGYKEKKLDHLENTIKRIASEIIQTKIEVKLDSMNSYERRFVHSIINEYTMLETRSEGEEPNRCVIIYYKQD